MTIQRQYSLPNCTLTLEGVGEDASDLGARPQLKMLVNAECQFVGQDQPLSGGSDFFEGLVAAVSRYAQEVLSGVPAPPSRNGNSPVELRLGANHLHHLVVRSPDATNGNGGVPSADRELKLSTVELFDLVEAVDQALADTQTLPHLSLQLKPAPKRRISSGEPMTKQVLPATLGLSSLVAAAAVFFFLPVPEVQRVEEPAGESSTIESITESGNPTEEAAGSPPDQDTTPTGDDDLSGAAAGEATTAGESEADAETANAVADTATEPDAGLEDAELEETLETSPPLADRDTILELNRNLRSRIDDAWNRDEADFSQDLVYRVAVTSNGEIVGYKYDSSAALENVEQTPLPELRRADQIEAVSPREPISQHKVVLRPDGVVEVSPWFALPEENSAAQTDPTDQTNSDTPGDAASLGITNAADLEQLNTELQEAIWDNLEQRTFPTALEYRVTFDQGGNVLSIEPQNQAAQDYADDVPLPELPSASSSNQPREDFRVVFTERGIPEVSPWDGYPPN
jgi:hypothetical protein